MVQISQEDQNKATAGNSEVTIYQRAVAICGIDTGSEGVPINSNMDQQGQQVFNPADQFNKRDSSSSEEMMNISDEDNNFTVNEYILGNSKKPRFEERSSDEHAGPSTSRAPQVGVYTGRPQANRSDGERLLQQAESSKIRILEVPGKNVLINQANQVTPDNFLAKVSGELMHSVIVDEEFSMVAFHVSEATKKKIINGEYIDFVKLLPREDWNVDQTEIDVDQFVMVNKGGHAYWAPESDVAESRRASGLSISSLHKWEQAFRIFSHIYTTAHPGRATELTQYSFIIHDAAQSFPWDNVYSYDVIFRRHMSRFPARNWGIILQQAWAMKMRNRTNLPRNSRDNRSNKGTHGAGKRDVCWKFNTGRCTFGISCKFEHKCALCMKFGHGAHDCRRANSDGKRETREQGDKREARDYPPRNDRFHYTKNNVHKEQHYKNRD